MWVFLATDVVLLGAAIVIAKMQPRPWTETTVMAIVACIIVGAIVGLVPMITYYERQKNEMLDDRQRALEALARTVASSAEQISIAAGGLHEIAELAQKNLRQAEQLPHRLQEKIAEFQAQLANANDVEKEELEKELEELRSSETEKLQTASDKISRTTAEFAKLETATQQHLAAATEALSKLSFGTASAIGKAQVAAEQALAQARQEASRTLGEASGNAIRSIETAKTDANTEIAAEFDRQVARIKEASGEMAALLEKFQIAARSAEAALQPDALRAAVASVATSLQPAALTAVPEPGAPAGDVPNGSAPSSDAAAEQASTEATTPDTVRPPKRPRKRREEAAAQEPTAAIEAAAVSEVPVPEGHTTPLEPSPTTESAAGATAASEPSIGSEASAEALSSAPAPADPVDISPEAAVAPAPEPAANEEAPSEPSAPTPAAEPVPAPAPATETPKPARKRTARKPDDDQPGLGLDLDEPNGSTDAPSGIMERVLSSDGATRLIVTAYIGIGNRLFIRGEGPGLSWEKGVPLQFVSIGKWRWETNDANGPVQFKLFKNDEHECTTLGQLTIDPGHQHEVTATF